jgi:hypothetical protein
VLNFFYFYKPGFSEISTLHFNNGRLSSELSSLDTRPDYHFSDIPLTPE